MPRKRAVAPKASAKTESQGICFTIMPFGGYFDSYYTDIYRPAIEKARLEPRRADDIYLPSPIVHDIWDLTQKAKVVLADLTGRNPNVFYELGLAHAIAKPVVLVAGSMDDVPFDLRALRCIIYNRNLPDWGKVLQDSIEKAITGVLASPNEAVLPSFLGVKKSARPEVSSTERELISMRQEIDALRRDFSKDALYEPGRLPQSTTEQLVGYALKRMELGVLTVPLINSIANRFGVSLLEAEYVVNLAKISFRKNRNDRSSASVLADASNAKTEADSALPSQSS